MKETHPRHIFWKQMEKATKNPDPPKDLVAVLNPTGKPPTPLEYPRGIIIHPLAFYLSRKAFKNGA